MQKFYVCPTTVTPEICFSPEENVFLIRGNSAPEDVRSLYYPVIEWIKSFVDDILQGKNEQYSSEKPFKFQIDMSYFNSSSAKFFFDILLELKRLIPAGIPVVIEWFHDKEDSDLKEAGTDIASLVNMEFTYIAKNR